MDQELEEPDYIHELAWMQSGLAHSLPLKRGDLSTVTVADKCL